MGLLHLELIVEGKVQAVGYRDLVVEKSDESNVRVKVENLKERNKVRIICEGEKTDLNKFKEAINVQQYPIKVIKIKEKEVQEIPDFTIPYSEIIRKDVAAETAERADEAAIYMRSMAGEMRGLKTEMHDFKTETNQNFETLLTETRGVKTGVSGLKTEVSGLKAETHNFRIETNQNFGTMSDKYGTISSQLKVISKGLNEIAKDFKSKK